LSFVVETFVVERHLVNALPVWLVVFASKWSVPPLYHNRVIQKAGEETRNEKEGVTKARKSREG